MKWLRIMAVVIVLLSRIVDAIEESKKRPTGEGRS